VKPGLLADRGSLKCRSTDAKSVEAVDTTLHGIPQSHDFNQRRRARSGHLAITNMQPTDAERSRMRAATKVKGSVQAILSPRHVAFWALLSSIATVVAFAVALGTRNADEARSGAPPDNGGEHSRTTDVAAPRDGYTLTVNSNEAVLAAVGPSGALHYVFPYGVTPPAAPDHGFDCYTWAHSNRGEDFGVTVLQFTIAAQTVQVVAESIELEIVERRPPQPGTVMDCGGGDWIAGRFLEIDLDDGSAVFTHHVDPRQGEGSTGPFALLLRPNDAEQVQVIARADKIAPDFGAYVWRLKLNLLVNGVPMTKTLDDGGRPFVTVARTGGLVVVPS
jgi:hypothetical protein